METRETKNEIKIEINLWWIAGALFCLVCWAAFAKGVFG